VRLVYTRALQPGMLLARPVYSERGELLLNADVELTDRYVDMLNRRGFQAVYVRDPSSGEVALPDVVPESIRRTLASSLWAAFDTLDRALSPFRDAEPGLTEAVLESPGFAQAIRERVSYPTLDVEMDALLDDLLTGPPVVGVIATRTVHGYLVPHAIDSTAVAIQIGRKVGYKRDDLHRLAVGCLLHDVGMAAIDPIVLERRGRLNARELAMVQRHTLVGYHILKALRPAAVLVQHVAYQHHERQDGRGYPRGLRGGNQIARGVERTGGGYITLDAEIVAVADVYAALSGGRGYRSALPPDHVVRAMSRLAGGHLNRELVAALLTLVPVYPLGTEVFLKSGAYRNFRGIVVRVHRETLDRPTIRLLYDDHREPIRPIEIDLRRTQDAIGCIPLSGYLVGSGLGLRPTEGSAA
jgi:HD-GYP domain-containing protein (c-di-GMP phosphodiesterase class II)